MDLISLKIIALVILLLIGGIFATIPLILVKAILKKQLKADRILSFGSTLAGGIFLGGGFIHLLPEAITLFGNLGINFSGIPMAELLAVAGFLAVFFVEKVVFLKDGNQKQTKSDAQRKSPLTDGAMVELEEVDIKEEAEERSAEPTMEHSHLVINSNSSSPLPYLLTVVLSIHSVIAGFALGVQNSLDFTYAIFFAILAHKWVESFALGVSLIKSNIERAMLIKCIILYSCMVPLGIIIGLILSFVVSGEASNIIQATVGGIASGTFIYIALVDILLVEFAIARDKWWKYLLTVVGFTVITLAVLLFDTDPSES